MADSESAYLYQTRSSTLTGRRIRLREARADFDGYIAELLSTSLSQPQLDQPLTPEDRERLLAYLRRLGALDQQRQYRGSPRRSGYEQRSAPLSFPDLLGANFDFYVRIDWDSQPTTAARYTIRFPNRAARAGGKRQVGGGMDGRRRAPGSRAGGC